MSVTRTLLLRSKTPWYCAPPPPTGAEARAVLQVGPGSEPGRKDAVSSMVVVEGQADLLQVVLALGAGGRLAHLLDGGQEQADEDGDDGDHHQQLDQREPAA